MRLTLLSSSFNASGNGMSRPSPLQNRCQPDGTLIAVPERGLFMGNRGGRFHDGTYGLHKRHWASRQWIICVTEFKERQRRVMGQSYTEVFFLDEATALAAGHRPCFECRRKDAVRFAELLGARGKRMRADDIDRRLETERKGPKERRSLSSLPDGAMIVENGRFLLCWQGQLREWSPSGYQAPEALVDREVDVLTPLTTLKALRLGYAPTLALTAS
jgi:hypothetical protein